MLMYHRRSSYILHIIDRTNVMMSLFYNHFGGGRFPPDETLVLIVADFDVEASLSNKSEQKLRSLNLNVGS